MDFISTASIVICGLLYVLIGYAGYATLGDRVSSNLLESYPGGDYAVVVARVGFAALVSSSYPLMAKPARGSVFSLLENHPNAARAAAHAAAAVAEIRPLARRAAERVSRRVLPVLPAPAVPPLLPSPAVPAPALVFLVAHIRVPNDRRRIRTRPRLPRFRHPAQPMKRTSWCFQTPHVHKDSFKCLLVRPSLLHFCPMFLVPASFLRSGGRWRSEREAARPAASGAEAPAELL